MADLTLGVTPARLTVWLVDAAPFAATVAASEPFPAAPALAFDDGTTWTATLDSEGTTAAWVATAEQVATLADARPRRVTLADPDTHTVYAHGTAYVARVVGQGAPSTLPPVGSVTVTNLDGPRITYGTALTESPAYPGLYTIGA